MMTATNAGSAAADFLRALLDVAPALAVVAVVPPLLTRFLFALKRRLQKWHIR